jgi:hypothetical protein
VKDLVAGPYSRTKGLRRKSATPRERTIEAKEHPEAVSALDRLKDDEAFVPALLWFEIRNLLLPRG